MDEHVLLHQPAAQHRAQVVAVALGGEAFADVAHVEHDVDARAVLAEHRLVGPALVGRRILRRLCAQRLLEGPTIAALWTRWRQTRLFEGRNAHLIIIAFMRRTTSFGDTIW